MNEMTQTQIESEKTALPVKTMKAAILVELNKPLVVAEIELPKRLLFGQVLVKVHYSGICGAQFNEIQGAKGPDKFLPHLLGHEGSATVLAVGEGTTSVKPNDHVVMHWRQSDGIQCQLPSYNWNGKKVNAGWVTTFNNHAIVSENRLTVIPDDFDLTIAPLFGCAVTTAMGVINNDAQVKVGQSVVIYGAGGVGFNLCQSANMVSADPIIAIDLFDSKLAMAKKMGATHVINANTCNDVPAQIKEIVGEKGADIIIDTTGLSQVIEQAYELTHPDGKTILVGVPKREDKVTIDTLPIHFNHILKGSFGGDCVPDKEIPRYIRLIKKGKMTLDGLITHEFKLEDINKALDTIRRGETGRVVINMEG